MSSLDTRLAHLPAPPVPPMPDPALAAAVLRHVGWAHPDRGRSQVVLASGAGGGWWERCCTGAELAQQALVRAGATDQYMSHHGFHGGRSTARLAELRACHVDLDTYTLPAWTGRMPGAVTAQLLAAIADADLPQPSLVLFTGRGLHVSWLIDPVPARALPRWTAVQGHLVGQLRPFGADPAAATATTCTRLAGTRNGRSGLLVVPTFVHPHLASHGTRWTLEEMARHTLPLTRKQLAECQAARRAERQARQMVDRTAGNEVAGSDRRRPVTPCTVRSYWETAIADLHRLLQHRWNGRLPPHHRNEWLWLRAAAGAWLQTAAELETGMATLAEELAGWTPKQTRNALGSVLRRARQAEAGQRIQRGGTSHDPRYRPRAATIVCRLGITPAEMAAAGLRVLVDRDRARALATERKRASRRRAGTPPRASYERDRAAEALDHARATLAAVAAAGCVAAAAWQAGIPVSTMRVRHGRAMARVTAAEHGASR